VHPIGNEVRYFAGDAEIEESAIKPGQPYSVFPKKFPRQEDVAAKTKDKINPVRMEGPFIYIQWMLLSETGEHLMMPTGATVPEEISLAQFWPKCIANRCRRPAKSLSWGKHFRGGVEIESGKVTGLLENDGVEAIISNKKKEKSDGRLEVAYTIGEEPQVYRLWVKSDATIGDVKKMIALAHKGKPIEALSFEGADLADEDPYNDWMTRTGGKQRQLLVKIVPMVQVMIDWMGTQQQMCARKNWKKEDFVSAVQTFLGTSHKLDVFPLGLDEWEIRAGFLYEIREIRKVSLKCQDVEGRKFTIDIAGTKSTYEVCEACRRQWGTPLWVKIHIKRQDDKPFYLGDGAKYSVVTEYVPDDDPRPEVTLRVDLLDGSFVIENIRIDDDPAKVLKMLAEKYGFPATKTTQVKFSPETPWVSGQTVCVAFKTATSCSAVKLEPFTRPEFVLYIADDPWESGEILLPTSFGKVKIWEHLQTLHSIPDVTQFQVVSGKKEITKDDRWTEGKIEAIPCTFPVTWRIEWPQEPSGIREVVQEKMSPLVTAREAWTQLHSIVPGLYEDAARDFRGNLRPGLTISAEIIRQSVKVAVEFEVIRKGKIKFILEVIPNMATWAEIHAHFSSFDERIPPFDCYVNEEIRPYYPDELLEFKIVKGMEIPDTSKGFEGAAGGISRGGFLLPAIVFPKAPIDISEGKVQGGKREVLDDTGGTDSYSDSIEDEEGEDDHKLRRLVQAAAKGQEMTVEIRGEYLYGGQYHEAIFAKTFKGMSKPDHMIEPLKVAHRQVEQVGKALQGGGLPQSCVWTTLGLPRDQIEVAVIKKGLGVHVRYGFSASTALDMENLPQRVRAEFGGGCSITFGTSEDPRDGGLTERLVYITAQ
jgi:hypothetical protein